MHLSGRCIDVEMLVQQSCQMGPAVPGSTMTELGGWVETLGGGICKMSGHTHSWYPPSSTQDAKGIK